MGQAMAPTVNIARLIRQNDQYSNAIKHDHELHVVSSPHAAPALLSAATFIFSAAAVKVLQTVA